MMNTAIPNEHSLPEENNAARWRRFYIYQKERFPLLAHGPLIAVFTFSAISYSRICRGAPGFIGWHTYAAGTFITITLFLLLRLFDEFKDAHDDAAMRKHLPVPRGLVTLRELGVVAAVVFLFQAIVIILAFPSMFVLYGVVIGYLLLMGREFFVAEWLKRRQFWYVVSHMMIIPLVDVFASGLDWYLEEAEAPFGLFYFFAVSFMNGIVLEVGRKIRVPEHEEHNTYSTMLGPVKATLLWIAVLAATLGLAVLACSYAGYGITGLAVLSAIFVFCLVPAIVFLTRMTKKRSKAIEYASAAWTAAMYLTLGGVPMLTRILQW